MSARTDARKEVLPTIDGVRRSLQDRDPFCSGMCVIPDYQRVLYYTDGDQSRLIDLSNAGSDGLNALYRACKPAEFGRGGETLLDPSYRKAGKMDLDAFSTLFDPRSLGIHEQVSKALLLQAYPTMETQLYKLNVYGEGDFFKAHQDTPRSQDMFGSLVVVLPTVHEGGQLVLRHAEKEWTVDPASKIAAAQEHSACFIAFYGDFEHEVLPVTSGYRITLTYNLYQKPTYPGTSPLSPIPTPFHGQLKQALVDLINDGSVLPEGGYLGFGLAHEYPHTGRDLLEPLPGLLKGSDRALADTCDALGLSYILRLFYRNPGNSGLNLITTEKLHVTSRAMEMSGTEYLVYALRKLRSDQAQGVKVVGEHRQYYLEEFPAKIVERMLKEPMTEVVEVTRLKSSVDVKSAMLAYGNEASLQYFYGTACMFVPVGPAATRQLNVVE